MTPQERKSKIKQLKEEITSRHQEVGELTRSCHHKIIVQTEPPDEFDCYGYAQCEGCDASFDWYCPDSPDHVCHYHTVVENSLAVVELISGERIQCPSEHDTRYETSDQCIYCGLPEERK